MAKWTGQARARMTTISAALVSCALASAAMAACGGVGTTGDPPDPGSAAPSPVPSAPTSTPSPSPSPLPASDASTPDAGGPCGTDLVPPDESAPCSSCGTRPCQKNGCYNGFYCSRSTASCETPPINCGTGAGVSYDGGAPVTGTVGRDGGKVSRLSFAVVGDTRPAMIDDTTGYPSGVIEKVYGALEARAPQVPFAISTGDYNFSSSFGPEAAKQLGLYAKARAKYAGAWFPAMGNHECTGMTRSNCGTGNVDGETDIFTEYKKQLLSPVGKSDVYYSIRVDALDGSWTSKLVFVAANAWTPAQATWLEATLGQPTTYTFVVRHEARVVTSAPGVAPSEAIMAKYPYTMSIVGHDHTYGKTAAREITVGNGGAPLSDSVAYGYALLDQRADGAITVDMIDVDTGLADSAFQFSVRADGSVVP